VATNVRRNKMDWWIGWNPCRLGSSLCRSFRLKLIPLKVNWRILKFRENGRN